MGKKSKTKARARHKPTDPAEAARIMRERRHNPATWGVNAEALSEEQNGNVQLQKETREKTARIYRWDAFALLHNRGGLAHGDPDESLARLNGVRRFEEVLAVRMRLEGTQGAGVGGGRAIPISDRSVGAAECLEAIEAAMSPFCHGLLMRLVSPAVQSGQCVNNWRKVVQDHCGEHRHVEQGKLVAACSGDLLAAWQAWDNRAKKAA